MSNSWFTEGQIVSILKQIEGGRNVKDVCREHGHVMESPDPNDDLSLFKEL